jgi:hypothetical protein
MQHLEFFSRHFTRFVGELNQIQAVGKLRFSSKRRIRLPFVGAF